MLDIDLIRRRRAELGLSHRAIGRHLGVTSLTISRLEDGSNHDDMTVRLLARLAELLALPVTALFATDGPDAAEPEQAPAVRDVGALVASADTPVTASTLADTLGTTLAEANDLLAVLDAALRPAGMVLHRSPDGAEIVPDATCRSSARLQQLLRAQHTVHGLTATDATLLARAHAGTLDVGRLGNDGQVALARLLNAGMLDDDHQLTEEVAFSLGLA